jgi:hypothetical protein
MDYQGEDRRTMLPQCQIEIAQIKSEIQSIKEVNQNILLQIKEIKKLLDGNGSLGICSKVQVLWTSSLFFVVTLIGVVIKVFTK